MDLRAGLGDMEKSKIRDPQVSNLCFIKHVGSRYTDRATAARKSRVFCDVTPCGSCKNRRFGGT
jgi:hypothetical protein